VRTGVAAEVPPGRGPRGTTRCVVIGVGNEYRRDDGFGPAVVARVAGLRDAGDWPSDVDLAVGDGEPARLLELWSGVGLAVVVDAVRDGGGRPGHRYELVLEEVAGLVDDRSASSHGVSLGSTVELGRALGRMPGRLVVLAVAGREFGFGAGLTAEVAAAVDPVVDRVRTLVR
jgi:hydrogenase maturation protease